MKTVKKYVVRWYGCFMKHDKIPSAAKFPQTFYYLMLEEYIQKAYIARHNPSMTDKIV